MNLIIDSGNTKCKLALFQGDELIQKFSLKTLNTEAILNRIRSFPEISHVLLCNVAKSNPELNEALKQGFRFHELNAASKLNFNNTYASPETLGSDRKANIAGTAALYPGKNCLVIDMGTCIKYDLVTADGNYLGGSISPGISLRFKAMNDYTDRLPLLRAEKLPENFIGTDTISSMQTGVMIGVLGELKHLVQCYRDQFSDLIVILTGGDCHYFVPALKNDIFALPDLTLFGLNKILELNA